MNKLYFQQEEPRLGNQYLEDSVLVSLLHRKVPLDVLQTFEQDLVTFGDRVAPDGDVLKYAKACETNTPRLTKYNAWGRRIDKITVDAGWDRLHDISAEEGLVAIGYERKFGEWSRLVQYVKLYLFSTSSATYTCPLAMTDGAARLIEVYGNQLQTEAHRELLKNAYQHLTTRDPTQFWTSGQWMTEKTGGSDIRPSETVARYDPSQGMYLLTGLKFFTSATTSEMAITLARTQPNLPLSAFFLQTKNHNKSQQQAGSDLNGIIIHKLKEKLGTRAVPTAELSLNNSVAVLVGKEGEGVKVISELFNITRIFNACSSVASCRRVIALARDFASRRKNFGRYLSENPLHLATLAKMETEFRAGLHFLIDVLIKFGKTEVFPEKSKKEAQMLRLLTPLLKLYTAKQSIAVVSEGVEAIGGTGYMEDSGIPAIFRGAQVTSIWEGTTNVLSHDIWRPIQKQNALPIFIESVKELLAGLNGKNIPERFLELRNEIFSALNSIEGFVARAWKDAEILEPNAREFAYSMSRVYMCALLTEHAAATGLEADFVAAKRFLEGGLYLVHEEKSKVMNDRLLAMDVDELTGKMRGMGDVDARGIMRARY